MIGIDDVRSAAAALDGVAHRTPVLSSQTLDAATGATVFCKAECYQRGGAFKFRGAYSMISRVPPDERARGVAAYSSGNHAQAVAIAAAMLDAPAVILMPEDAPAAKLDATRGYGAEVVTYDRYSQDRDQLGRELAESRGLTLVPPYEHPLVMSGQGTAALELLEQAPGLDALLVPVGGGGLLAGCATAAKALAPDIEMIGVEPEQGDDTRRSLAAGERVRIPMPRTIADGQQVETPGELTFEVNRQLADSVELVSDGEIIDAMLFAFDRMKVVLEPSGACALAALLAGRVHLPGRRVGVVLSGGNVGAARFAELTAVAAASK
ncbi:MAG TPA: pyridoxal-phosphate dependent enzyme [Gaiellales bacterium]|jgi:threonine dehydratase|nr:pyridoxal-phosphate dependent enzyme [Gaiellales bacterium]